MSLRTLALSSLLLLVACGQDVPTDASKAAATKAAATKAAATKAAPGSVPKSKLPPGDPHAAPAMGEEEAKPPLMDSAPGTFDLTVEGTLAHYTRIPTGQNRAVAIAADDVARVSIAAAENDQGWPHVRLVIEGFRPDQAEYPLTLSSTAKDGPTLSLRYQVNDNRIYEINADKGAEVEVTLDAFEGPTLRGSFEGTLAPTAAALGEPIPIKGVFAIALGLRNVEPGPAAVEGNAVPEPAKPSEGAPSEGAAPAEPPAK